MFTKRCLKCVINLTYTDCRYRTPTSTSLHLSSMYSGLMLAAYVLSLSGSVNIYIANLQLAPIEEAGIV